MSRPTDEDLQQPDLILLRLVLLEKSFLRMICDFRTITSF
jgi:hypothetical protein